MTTLLAALALQAVAPTHADVKYDARHERNVLDVWLAKSDKPTPLFVWFHGGGFTKGDKKSVQKTLVAEFLAKGVSVASCNYPFLKDASYEEIMRHCARAVQFLRSKAAAWNIDPARIGAAGGSAGALISQWVAYHPDLADPKSPDPVAKMSSSLVAVGGVQQPMGTAELVLPHMRAGGPPLFLLTYSPESDAVHHPKYARLIKGKADDLRIRAEIYGGPKNDLPPPPDGALLKFFCDAFGR